MHLPAGVTRNFLAAVTLCCDFGAPKRKSDTVSTVSPSICLSAMQETWVRSLGWEDPLDKEMAAHSSILAWKILLAEEPGLDLPIGLRRFLER